MLEHEHEPDAPQSLADLFPKAPIVPFPVESTSLALTSVVELLAAIDTPAILLGADKSVKFVSNAASKLLGLSAGEKLTPRALEMKLGIAIPESGASYATSLVIGDTPVEFSSIPLAGGAGGSVLLLKQPIAGDVDSEVLAFVRETLLEPLEALRAALSSAAKGRKDPIIGDAVGTIDQVLSSLELSPHLAGAMPVRAAAPPLPVVLKETVARFEKEASAKAIRIQLDTPETTETLADHAELSEVLGYLIENSLHYVPHGGQVVVGLRFLEHKGKPLILFFVMDNGPVVPEEMREAIFNPGFIWDPSGDSRSGDKLSKCRNFAVSHGGQIWVESKTGKACTFFLRVRPDSER